MKKWSIKTWTIVIAVLTLALVVIPFILHDAPKHMENNIHANQQTGTGVQAETISGSTINIYSANNDINTKPSSFFHLTPKTIPFTTEKFQKDFSISLSFYMEDYDNAWPSILFMGGKVSAMGVGVVGKTSGTLSPENIGTFVSTSEAANETRKFNWFMNSHVDVPLNQTNFLVFVKKSSMVSLYLNGECIGTAKIQNDAFPPINNLIVGKGKNEDSYFHGSITNVQTYDHALNLGEVAALKPN